MKYVLDSNVFKKISSQKRNKNIDKWLASIDDADLFITALTVQETQEGIERLRKNKDPAKVAAANEIERRFEEYLSEYEDRILPVDAKAAREWGRRLAKHGTKKANDLAIISIVAMQNDAVAVSQNLCDFRHRGITVINRYDDPPSEFSDPET